jgi:hypothetical protein
MDDNYNLVKNLMDIVNTQMKKSSEDAIIKCLDMYVKLLTNIVEHPYEVKYRKIKKKSKLVSDSIGSVSGGLDMLYLIGWVVKVLEFEEWIVWEGKIGELEMALAWAKEKMQNVHEKSLNAAASETAAQKKEEAYQENLKRAVEQERKERYQKQHGAQ